MNKKWVFLLLVSILASCSQTSLEPPTSQIETPDNHSTQPITQNTSTYSTYFNNDQHLAYTQIFTQASKQEMWIRFQSDVNIQESSYELEEMSYQALRASTTQNQEPSVYELRTGNKTYFGEATYCIQDVCYMTTELVPGQRSIRFEPILLADIQETIELYINDQLVETIHRPQKPTLQAFEVGADEENILLYTNASNATKLQVVYFVNNRTAVIDGRVNTPRTYTKQNINTISDQVPIRVLLNDGFHVYEAEIVVQTSRLQLPENPTKIFLREQPPLEFIPGTSRMITIDRVYNPVTGWYTGPRSDNDMNYVWELNGINIQPFLDIEHQQLLIGDEFWNDADYKYGNFTLRITAWPTGHKELQGNITVPVQIISYAQEQHNKGNPISYVWNFEREEQTKITLQENNLLVTNNTTQAYNISDAQAKEILHYVEAIKPKEYGMTKPSNHQRLDLWIHGYECADFSCSEQAIQLKKKLFETLEQAAQKTYSCKDFQDEQYCVFEEALLAKDHTICYELENARSCVIQVAAWLNKPSICEAVDSRYTNICLRQIEHRQEQEH